MFNNISSDKSPSEILRDFLKELPQNAKGSSSQNTKVQFYANYLINNIKNEQVILKDLESLVECYSMFLQIREKGGFKRFFGKSKTEKCLERLFSKIQETSHVFLPKMLFTCLKQMPENKKASESLNREAQKISQFLIKLDLSRIDPFKEEIESAKKRFEKIADQGGFQRSCCAKSKTEKFLSDFFKRFDEYSRNKLPVPNHRSHSISISLSEDEVQEHREAVRKRTQSISISPHSLDAASPTSTSSLSDADHLEPETISAPKKRTARHWKRQTSLEHLEEQSAQLKGDALRAFLENAIHQYGCESEHEYQNSLRDSLALPKEYEGEALLKHRITEICVEKGFLSLVNDFHKAQR